MRYGDLRPGDMVVHPDSGKFYFVARVVPVLDKTGACDFHWLHMDGTIGVQSQVFTSQDMSGSGKWYHLDVYRDGKLVS